MIAIVTATPAMAERAFCNVTPCDQREITRRRLTMELPAGPVTCKRGQDVGEDARKRVVYCTTAKVVTVDGIVIAANAYTLFHPNGKIYQSTVAKPFERTLGDGSKVSCGVEHVSLDDKGALLFCKLAAARAGSPKPKVGENVAFHPNGKLAGFTLDEPYTSQGISLPMGASVSFDDKGNLVGGWLKDPALVGGLSLWWDFRLWPNGKLQTAQLDKQAKIQGHDFPRHAKLTFRVDGSLEAAEYVEKEGFMIHGEEWSDTRFVTFDKAGKVLTTRVEHYQSTARPPKFKK